MDANAQPGGKIVRWWTLKYAEPVAFDNLALVSSSAFWTGQSPPCVQRTSRVVVAERLVHAYTMGQYWMVVNVCKRQHIFMGKLPEMIFCLRLDQYFSPSFDLLSADRRPRQSDPSEPECPNPCASHIVILQSILPAQRFARSSSDTVRIHAATGRTHTRHLGPSRQLRGRRVPRVDVQDVLGHWALHPGAFAIHRRIMGWRPHHMRRR